MFVSVLVCITLYLFYFCNLLKEKDGCFAFKDLRIYCCCKFLWLFLTEPLVGLQ